MDHSAEGRRSLWRSRSSGLPFFASSGTDERERSGSDVLLLITTSIPVAVIANLAVPQSGFEKAVMGVIDAVPSFLDAFWRLGLGWLAVWCVVVLGTACWRRRGDVLVDVALSSVVGVGMALLLDLRVDGQWPTVAEALTGGSTGSIPLVALVAAAALSSAASPHLSRPARRLGRWSVIIAVTSVVLLGSTTPAGGLASALVGVGAAAIVHLVLGSSTGRPSIPEVADALAQLGVRVTELVAAPRQHSGVFAVEGVGDDGVPVRIAVYGRDARDTALLVRAWRALWYRQGAAMVLSRLQQVEHEGFMTFLAASRGVRVPRVIVAGLTDRRDALIAVTDAGRPLVDVLPDGSLEPVAVPDSVAAPESADAPAASVAESADAADAAAVAGRDAVPDRVDDDVVRGIWDIVGTLHAGGLAHGELSVESFAIADSADTGAGADSAEAGQLVLTELAPVALATSDDQRRIDLAQTLVTTALLVGIERSVVVAAERLGADGVASMLAHLQVPALGTTLRHQVKAAKFDIEALRSAAAGVADVEVPEIAKLRRVSPQTLLSAGLLILVAFALITALGHVDLEELGQELAGASPYLLVGAVLFSQTPFLSQAITTIGACPRPIPYGPVVMLQLAVAFVALAVPSTAGRVALGIRFFQRQGIPAGAAVSISAIDSFSGFLVQISLLFLTLVVGVGRVDLSFEKLSTGNLSDLSWVLGVALAVFVVLVVLALALGRIRRRIWARVRPFIDDARDTLSSLRSPLKLLQLFGGNLLNQILFALALGLCLRAFGGQLNLSTLIVIYVGAALFGGMMPVPGGIGVMEAALMAGLIAADIDPTTATATALLFRGATFYLPPIWGWFGMRWLQRHSYL